MPHLLLKKDDMINIMCSVDVVDVKPQCEKKVIGNVSQPIRKELNNEYLICIWKNEIPNS